MEKTTFKIELFHCNVNKKLNHLLYPKLMHQYKLLKTLLILPFSN